MVLLGAYMHRYLFFLALIGLFFVVMGGAQAEVRVNVVATAPPAETMLGHHLHEISVAQL